MNDASGRQCYLLDQSHSQLARFLEAHERGLTIPMDGTPVNLRRASKVEIACSEEPFGVHAADARRTIQDPRRIRDLEYRTTFDHLAIAKDHPGPRESHRKDRIEPSRRLAPPEWSVPPKVRALSTPEFARWKPKGQVFLVFGQDRELRVEIEQFFRASEIECTPIDVRGGSAVALIDQVEGQPDIDFAVVLLSADDVVTGPASRKAENRAGQNLIWAWGVLVGKLGGTRVLCVSRPEISLPAALVSEVGVVVKSSLAEFKRILFKRMGRTQLVHGRVI
jgi:hypothetical protein